MNKNFIPLAPINQFVSLFSSSYGEESLKTHYGTDSAFLQERNAIFIELIQQFTRNFPQEDSVYLLRVPARVNLMGVHIDHRGGNTNYLPIGRETFFCFSPRQDDRIVVRNANSKYPAFEFSLGEELPSSHRGDWLSYIESRSLSAGFWGNYIQAGALKLQDEHPQTPLKGMNVMIDGDIPPNAGVSSSSTLVVGSLLALCQINKIPLAWDELVERAGSAEWYVGTRGGAGDHAAMLLGRYRKILHAGFKPFTTSYFPFPEQVDVFLLLSGIDSRKSAETKHTFNSRIASYELALHLFHAAWPAFQAKIPLIRDIHPEQMGISLAQLYQTIKKIPVQATWAELQQEYPCPRDEIARIAKMYQVGTEPLPLREVFLFGIAECQRAKRFPALLEKGGIQEAGELMYISHNGDRVASWVHETPRPYRSAFTDAYLDRLSHLAEKGAPEADLHVQPGGYRCSLPEMDLIVDICKHIPGVYGAGLTGAGLGGAIVALADRAKTNTIQAMLNEFMNDLALHRAKIELCRPVAGAAFIEPLPA